AFGVGLSTGLLSGLFGIGSSSFIQIGLLVFFGLPVQQAAGTTFLIVLPLAFVGGIGYYSAGNLDLLLFVKVAFGTVIGAYIGAKFTNRLHPVILKVALVIVPMIGGIMFIFGSITSKHCYVIFYYYMIFFFCMLDIYLVDMKFGFATYCEICFCNDYWSIYRG